MDRVFITKSELTKLIYTQISHNVEHVWIAGKPVVKNRQLLTLDEEKLRHNTTTWQQRLSKK